MIGSDFGGMAFIYPGYGMHEEMSLLQSIGIKNYDILKMATYNPAVYFNLTESYGSITEGLYADIIVFDKNPVVDINNSLKINYVIKHGKKVYEK